MRDRIPRMRDAVGGDLPAELLVVFRGLLLFA